MRSTSQPSVICSPCQGRGVTGGAHRPLPTGRGSLVAVSLCSHCLGHGVTMRPEDRDVLRAPVPTFSF